MTRMTDAQEQGREGIEDAMFALGSALKLCSLAELRIKQAIQRDCRMHELLNPVLEYVSRDEEAMRKAQEILGAFWKDSDENGW